MIMLTIRQALIMGLIYIQRFINAGKTCFMPINTDLLLTTRQLYEDKKRLIFSPSPSYVLTLILNSLTSDSVRGGVWPSSSRLELDYNNITQRLDYQWSAERQW